MRLEEGEPATTASPSELAPALQTAAADQQTAIKIQELLDGEIGRALRTDGGDIELIRLRENRVYVRLTGACAACRASDATIKGWVESLLREHVSEDLEVIEVKS
jgi:Fe-S cluster biogenesis protein NfuA